MNSAFPCRAPVRHHNGETVHPTHPFLPPLTPWPPGPREDDHRQHPLLPPPAWITVNTVQALTRRFSTSVVLLCDILPWKQKKKLLAERKAARGEEKKIIAVFKKQQLFIYLLIYLWVDTASCHRVTKCVTSTSTAPALSATVQRVTCWCVCQTSSCPRRTKKKTTHTRIGLNVIFSSREQICIYVYRPNTRWYRWSCCHFCHSNSIYIYFVVFLPSLNTLNVPYQSIFISSKRN